MQEAPPWMLFPKRQNDKSAPKLTRHPGAAPVSPTTHLSGVSAASQSQLFALGEQRIEIDVAANG